MALQLSSQVMILDVHNSTISLGRASLTSDISSVWNLDFSTAFTYFFARSEPVPAAECQHLPSATKAGGPHQAERVSSNSNDQICHPSCRTNTQDLDLSCSHRPGDQTTSVPDLPCPSYRLQVRNSVRSSRDTLGGERQGEISGPPERRFCHPSAWRF